MAGLKIHRINIAINIPCPFFFFACFECARKKAGPSIFSAKRLLIRPSATTQARAESDLLGASEVASARRVRVVPSNPRFDGEARRSRSLV